MFWTFCSKKFNFSFFFESKINKFSKKLTAKFIFDQIKIVILQWFDERGIFDMDIELIFKNRLAITDTSPRDMIYTHFKELLEKS